MIPSRNEPFGLVLLEAWSAKKPVVVSNVGGLGENVDSFMNGIKVDPDPNSLAWGISTLINNPSQAEVLGIRGRGKVDRVFQWSPIANRMTDAYARVSA